MRELSKISILSLITLWILAGCQAKSTSDGRFNPGIRVTEASKLVVSEVLSQSTLASSTYDFGSTAVGNSVHADLYITNTGERTARFSGFTGLGTPFSFRGGSFPGTGGTCGADLAGGQSCSVSLSFSPTTPGTASQSLTLNYSDNYGSQQNSRTTAFELAGSALNLASLTLSGSDPVNLGSLPTGTSTTLTLTLTNTGESHAQSLGATTLTAPFSFPGGTFPGTTGTCTNRLDPADSCTLVVRFSPTSSGAASDDLEINYHDGLSSQTLTRSLTGTGLVPASLAVLGVGTYTFPLTVLNTDTDYEFTLTNSGEAEASGLSATALSAPFSFAGGSYPGGGTCGSTLAGGALCTIGVRFTPTAEVTSSGTLMIGYSNGVSFTTLSASRSFRGTGNSYCGGSLLTNAPFAGGAGTSVSPYTICTVAQFNQLRNYLTNYYFELKADLDFTDTGFLPIGSNTSLFQGHIEGNNRTLSNWTYSSPSSDHVGLFAVLAPGSSRSIRNLRVTGFSVTGHDYVGLLAGRTGGSSINASVYNVTVSGSVNGRNWVGGIAGMGSSYFSVMNSTVNVTVNGTDYVGGIIGGSNTYCWLYGNTVSGSVNGSTYVGGIIGLLTSWSLLLRSSTSVAVSGNSYVGGAVGSVSNNTYVSNIYSTGNVSVSSYGGGLVGSLESSSLVTNSYSTGSVSASGSNLGGLIGSGVTQRTLYSFWNTQTSGKSTSSGGTGKTTSEMQSLSTYQAWDFYTQWTMNSGEYPTFLSTARTCVTGAGGFSGGSGTSGDPYLVSTVAELYNVGCNLTSHFRLTADLDLANGPTGTAGFPPLGGRNYFQGTFDGDGHSISNGFFSGNYFGFTGMATWGAGLFSVPHGSGVTIRDLQVLNSESYGDAYVGILAASFGSYVTLSNVSVSGRVHYANTSGGGLGGSISTYSTISNCTADVNIYAGGTVAGGLIGYLQAYSSIADSHATGSIYGYSSFGNSSIGGLVGYVNFNTTLTRSYATGNIQGSNNVGGLIGTTSSSTTISKCYATGNVSGTPYYNYPSALGGFAGQLSNGASISDSYAQGSVTGADSVGGFVGNNGSYTYFYRVYSSGRVTGSSNTGGFMGYSSTSNITVNDVYFDTTASTQSSSPYGTGMTTAQMQDSSNYNNWDFSTVWTIAPGGYPTLR